jgi:hypothetical protein
MCVCARVVGFWIDLPSTPVKCKQLGFLHKQIGFNKLETRLILLMVFYQITVKKITIKGLIDSMSGTNFLLFDLIFTFSKFGSLHNIISNLQFFLIN